MSKGRGSHADNLMKKKIMYLSIIFSFLFSTFLNAEAKEVPKLSSEQTSFKKKNWQPWAVAIVTLLVAATGLIVVSKNKGKKTHSENS